MSFVLAYRGLVDMYNINFLDFLEVRFAIDDLKELDKETKKYIDKQKKSK